MTTLNRFALVFVLCSLFPAAYAQSFTVLHSFSGPDGSEPQGGLIMDSGGNLYGTTQFGGSTGNGTVFKLSERNGNRILSTLYNFSGGQDGAYPLARVVFGPDGALYGTTSQGGGPDNYGTVFRLTPPATFCHAVQCPWSETVLYRFAGGADGAYPQYGDLAFDTAGSIYGTASKGGVYCSPFGTCGVVFKLTKSGQTWMQSVLYSFTGDSDGAIPYGGVVFDSTGNLYGTTGFGGARTYGTVFELSPAGSGWTETILHSFGTLFADGMNPFNGLTIDQQGNLYGATLFGGAGGGGVFELLPSDGGWTYVLLPSITPGTEGPTGMLTLDLSGNLWGVTEGGGLHFSGNVFALGRSGNDWTYIDFYDFGGQLSQQGLAGSGTVAVDYIDDVFGTTTAGGASNHGVIWEYQVY